MLHTSVQHQKQVTMELLCLVFGLCKQFTSRKFGSFCRMGLIAVFLLCSYMIASYILTASDGSVLESIGNDTGDYDQDVSLHNTFIPNEVLLLPPGMKFGDILLNCGLPESCKSNEFPVHIYTGKDHRDEPRLCLDGKYILTRNINGGGRGINVVVVDNMTKTVSKVSHFDTYEKESTALETLLLTLRPGDIAILLTFDEPTRKLSRVARLLFHELGSALIQNLNYRGSWYLITQKGLTGFSPFESLHTVENSGWPKHHDVRFCVPFEIKGQAVHPDPLPRVNSQRVEFCRTYGEYPLFCDADVVNEPLVPTPALKFSMSKRIYTVPVIIMSGSNTSYLPVTLETLIRQSGLNPSLVVVFHLPEQSEVPSLCDLFGFMSVELSSSPTYCERFREAFETAHLLFPDAKEFIVIQGMVVLSPNFMSYLGQTLPLLHMDPSIISVSAFNENGFEGVSDDPALLYRTESFSCLAAVVRHNFFQRAWCNNESESDPVYISSEIKGDSVIPDVSRVLPVPLAESEGFDDDIWTAMQAFNRTVCYEDIVTLRDVEKLQAASYEQTLNSLLENSKPVGLHSLEGLHCSHIRDGAYVSQGLGSSEYLLNATSSSQAYVMYVHQSDSSDRDAFHLISQCFSLFHHPTHGIRGLYQNVLRFRWRGHHVLVVGSASPFFKHKPAQYHPLVYYGARAH